MQPGLVLLWPHGMHATSGRCGGNAVDVEAPAANAACSVQRRGGV